MRKLGKLIVFEGADGSGKTTQAAAVRKRLLEMGRLVHAISYPNYANPETGIVISEFLRGEYGAVEAVHPRLLGLAFAVDRYSRKSELLGALETNDYVIADRYTFSNIAFQTAKVSGGKAAFREWIRRIEFDFFGMPLPDQVFILLAELEVIKRTTYRRISEPPREYIKEAIDIHEANDELQSRVLEEYKLMNGPEIFCINTTFENEWRVASMVTDEIMQTLVE
jgi:dTMP kinase